MAQTPAKVAFELKDGYRRVEVNVQELDEVVVITDDRATLIEADAGSTLAQALADSPGLKPAEAKKKTDKPEETK